MTMKFTTTALALAAFVGLSGCTAQNLCAKKAACADEEGDDLADDSPSVCQANYNGNLNALRANEEEECQILANAQEALDACRDTMPDAVLLDWNMPVMDGFEFLKELRRLPGGRDPKVVFCTTDNDIAHIAKAMRAGADEYIMKPFDKEIVESKFHEVGLI